MPTIPPRAKKPLVKRKPVRRGITNIPSSNGKISTPKSPKPTKKPPARKPSMTTTNSASGVSPSSSSSSKKPLRRKPTRKPTRKPSKADETKTLVSPRKLPSKSKPTKPTQSSQPSTPKQSSTSHEKDISMRTKIAQEIMSSEKVYTGQLTTLVDIYLKHLRFKAQLADQANAQKKKTECLLNSAEVTTIFANIETILGVNRTLLEDLEQVMKTYDPETTLLSSVFTSFAPYLKLYKFYINNYDAAIVELTKVSQRPEVQKYLSVNSQHPDCLATGPLSSFLILPIQRVPRYKLLLTDYIKHTWDDHPDAKGLQTALEQVSSIAKGINQGMKNYDRMQNVVRVQQSLTNYPPNLVEPHRFYVREGPISKNGQKRQWFLFNDSVVYAKKSGKQFVYKGQIFLGSCWINPLNDEKGQKNAFQIVSPNKTYTLVCDDPVEKDAWVKAFSEQIQQLVENNPELLRTREKVAGARKRSLLRKVTPKSIRTRSHRKSFFSSFNLTKTQGLLSMEDGEFKPTIISFPNHSFGVSYHFKSRPFALSTTLSPLLSKETMDLIGFENKTIASILNNSTEKTKHPQADMLFTQRKFTPWATLFTVPSTEKVTFSFLSPHKSKEGFLSKRGALNTEYKKRWFMIAKGFLFYFKGNSQKAEPAGVVPLIGASISRPEQQQSTSKKKLEIHITPKKVEDSSRTYILGSEDLELITSWNNALIAESNFNMDSINEDDLAFLSVILTNEKLRQSNWTVALQAAEQISHFCSDRQVCDFICSGKKIHDVLTVLMSCLSTTHILLLQTILKAISFISSSSGIQAKIYKSGVGAIDCFVDFLELSPKFSLCIQYCATILYHLTCFEETGFLSIPPKEQINDSPVNSLVRLLITPIVQVQYLALYALGNVGSSNAFHRKSLSETNISLIDNLLSSPHNLVKLVSARAIAIFSTSDKYRQLMLANNTTRSLIKVLRSLIVPTRRAITLTSSSRTLPTSSLGPSSSPNSSTFTSTSTSSALTTPPSIINPDHRKLRAATTLNSTAPMSMNGKEDGAQIVKNLLLEQIVVALAAISTNETGQQQIIDNVGLPPAKSLLSCTDDYPQYLAFAALKTFFLFTTSLNGREALLDAGILPSLLDLVSKLDGSISPLLLERALSVLSRLIYKKQIEEACRDLGALDTALAILNKVLNQSPSYSPFFTKNASTSSRQATLLNENLASQATSFFGSLCFHEETNREIFAAKDSISLLSKQLLFVVNQLKNMEKGIKTGTGLESPRSSGDQASSSGSASNSTMSAASTSPSSPASVLSPGEIEFHGGSLFEETLCRTIAHLSLDKSIQTKVASQNDLLICLLDITIGCRRMQTRVSAMHALANLVVDDLIRTNLCGLSLYNSMPALKCFIKCLQSRDSVLVELTISAISELVQNPQALQMLKQIGVVSACNEIINSPLQELKESAQWVVKTVERGL